MGVYDAILTIRNALNLILIIKAPTLSQVKYCAKAKDSTGYVVALTNLEAGVEVL